MKKSGTLDTGIQELDKDELSLRAGSVTSAKATPNGMHSNMGFMNPSTIVAGDTAKIPAGHQAVWAGPITVDGTLIVEGTLTII